MVSWEVRRVWYGKDNEKLIQGSLISTRRLTGFLPNMNNERWPLHRGDRYKMSYSVRNLEYYCSRRLASMR
jgi:hypothetical protein